MAVQPAFESWDTPDNYRSYRRFQIGADKLPNKMKVWLVQKIGRGNTGSVPDWEEFPDCPDEEILALGFNTGRAYGSAGISRQGSFLQWGYSGAPSQMTEAGQKLLVNCIHYIHRFDGQPPLGRGKPSDPRIGALRCADYMHRASDPKDFFLSCFPETLYEKYHADPNGLLEYYRSNIEWVYGDGAVPFQVDEDLKGLGLDSNRKIANLQRLIELLDDGQHAATARKLLSRYTGCSFETPSQWRQWFDKSKNRLYFTDTGGYKFKVVPEGYFPAEAAKK